MALWHRTGLWFALSEGVVLRQRRTKFDRFLLRDVCPMLHRCHLAWMLGLMSLWHFRCPDTQAVSRPAKRVEVAATRAIAA